MKQSWATLGLLERLVPAMLLGAIGLAAPRLAIANELPNGGFESGLTGWTLGGTGNAEDLQTSNFSTPVPPTEGVRYSLLSTGPGDEGGPAANLDGNSTNDFDQATLSTVFTVATDSEVSFDWVFLTSEVNQGAQYDDIFAVTLDGANILAHSVAKSGNFSPFPDTVAYDGLLYIVNSAGPTDGSRFPVSGGAGGRTPFASFATSVVPGTYTLEFWVADQADRAFDSGLLIDNVQVLPHADLAITKDDGLSSVNPGQQISYTLEATNLGPSVVLGASVSDPFPSALTNISWTCAASAGSSCTANGTGDINDLVTIPMGGTVTYTVTAIVDAGASGALSNTATITVPSDRFDPDGANNTATDIDLITAGVVQVTDSSSGVLTLKGGDFVFTPATNSHVRIDRSGSLIAFVSTADYTGANADLGNEVFAYETASQTFRQLTQVDSPMGYLHAQDLGLSDTGNWIAFSSTADLTGSNPDWNAEIFRLDVDGGAVLQVTNTSTCSNTMPSVNSNGRRIAFQTDCTDLVSGFNIDGNQEIVVWNDGSWRTVETTGCTSRDPSIYQANSGRYVVFVSDCNYTGQNSDGNLEIFRLDHRNGAMQQLTISSAAMGELNDSPTMSDTSNGRYVSFLSNADYSGGNADASLEVFRLDRNASSFLQVTDTAPTVLHLSVDMHEGGNHLTAEVFDVQSGSVAIYRYDAGGGTSTLVFVGDARLPVIAVDGSEPIVTFISTEDVGTNADGNPEIWLAR